MLTRLLAFTLALLGLHVQLSAQANGPWTIMESGVARVSPIQVTRGTFVHLFSRDSLDFLLMQDGQATTMSAYRDGRFISSISNANTFFRGGYFYAPRQFQLSLDKKSLYFSMQCPLDAPINSNGHCQAGRWDFDTNSLVELAYAGEMITLLNPVGPGEYPAQIRPEEYSPVGFPGGSIDGKEYLTLTITERGGIGQRATFTGLFEITRQSGQKKFRLIRAGSNPNGGYITGAVAVVTKDGLVVYLEHKAGSLTSSGLMAYDTKISKADYIYSVSGAYLYPYTDVTTGMLIAVVNNASGAKRVLPEPLEDLFTRGDPVGSYTADDPEPYKQNGLGSVAFYKGNWDGVAYRWRDGPLRLLTFTGEVVAGKAIPQIWGSSPHLCSVLVPTLIDAALTLDRLLEFRPIFVKSAEALEGGRTRICGCFNPAGTQLDTVLVEGLTARVVSRSVGADGYDVLVLEPAIPLYNGVTSNIGLTVNGAKTFFTDVKVTGIEASVEPPPPPPPPPPPSDESIGTSTSTRSPDTGRRGRR